MHRCGHTMDLLWPNRASPFDWRHQVARDVHAWPARAVHILQTSASCDIMLSDMCTKKHKRHAAVKGLVIVVISFTHSPSWHRITDVMSGEERLIQRTKV